ncbi:cytokinin oxidase 3 [Artemisia annua]|uniref:cytokinin dehydrogenase n=1 Tax=Artemisia annua TaxID=35608 RepID=A0A2U1N2H5_ARTAN|nr:cytokinin oxidase 3 [Artemisia annua]
MAYPHVLYAYFVIPFIINMFVFTALVSSRPWPPITIFSTFENESTIENNLCKDTICMKRASSDYGKLVQQIPIGVLRPSSVSDIVKLVKTSYESPSPFTIAARGNGHSVRGQAMAKDGVVVDMSTLNSSRGLFGNTGIRVSGDASLGFYADVGGEQLWIDVLRTTLAQGLAPVSWTDYLYLTVGGTLSNAGISGQSSFHGPQISNVLEMDVITGKGELMTCSKDNNSDLFYAVLGGLGQFGIITRARIVLDKAPKRVKWFKIIYNDFAKFTKDQEYLISVDGFNYVEGSLIMASSPADSFFSPSDESMISSLASKTGILYCLEAVKYYDDSILNTIGEELQNILKALHFDPGFIFNKVASLFDFLNRVRAEELLLTTLGLWDVPHPWLNLFVPRSRIMDFNQGVFVDIVKNQSESAGPFLVYPINRKKWDDRMSVVIPEDNDDMFYTVALLNSAGGTIDPAVIDKQNNDILEYCRKNGIMIKEYFPHYKKKEEWMKHFGKKWSVFKERKEQFDPKMILSPGQGIFNSE